MNSGALDRAEAIAASCLAENPSHPALLNLIGAIRFKQQRYVDSARYFSRALEAGTPSVPLLINLAQACDRAGEYGRAIEHLRHAAQIDPDTVQMQAVGSHYAAIGREALNKGDRTRAIDAFRASLSVDQDNADRGDLQFDDLATAIDVYEAILSQSPDATGIIERLAFAYRSAGSVEKSDQALGRLVDLLGRENEADAMFHDCYNRALIATGSGPRFQRRRRFRNISTALRQVASLPGEIAECGCAKGLSTYLIASYLQKFDPTFKGAGFHVFDSFAGLSSPTPKDLEGATGTARSHMERGRFAFSLAHVQQNLSDFPLIQYHPGWIPERFADVERSRFRFLNLDVDLYEPTRDALTFFFPRLVSGGIIVVDDFNWPGCRTAVEESAANYRFSYTLTANNQAVVVKS